MARIRSIKPEFFDSPGTAKASPYARLLYIAMWCWADDWGVGDANPRRLLGFAFPEDETSAVEPRNFRHLAAEVADCYDVTWFRVDGRDYYEVPTWETHQRTEKRAKRRNPTSDQAECILYSETSELPTRNLGKSADGTGEQGNRGTGEQGIFSSEIGSADDRPDERPEVDEILDDLEARIVANGAKRPTRGKKARDAIRLMLDRDGRTVEQIHAAIEYATGDEFWRGNILSAAKLREKYDQLSLNAQRSHWRPTDRHERERDFWETQAARAAEYDQGAPSVRQLEA